MGNFMALAAAVLSRKAAHDHKSKRTMRTASALISQRRPAIRFINLIRSRKANKAAPSPALQPFLGFTPLSRRLATREFIGSPF
jgi:hypothetical protein